MGVRKKARPRAPTPDWATTVSGAQMSSPTRQSQVQVEKDATAQTPSWTWQVTTTW